MIVLSIVMNVKIRRLGHRTTREISGSGLSRFVGWCQGSYTRKPSGRRETARCHCKFWYALLVTKDRSTASVHSYRWASCLLESESVDSSINYCHSRNMVRITQRGYECSMLRIVHPHCTQTPTTSTPCKAVIMLQMALRQFWHPVRITKVKGRKMRIECKTVNK